MLPPNFTLKRTHHEDFGKLLGNLRMLVGPLKGVPSPFTFTLYLTKGYKILLVPLPQ